MKTITLCADDYAFSPSISEAIIYLIKKNRLNSTGCMVNTIYWKNHAVALKPFLNRIDIGLHFALTDVQPAIISLYQHPKIIKQAYFRKLKQGEIERELQSQIETFEKVMGRLPNFIDGHQHIHQLPVIRDALLSVYEKIFPDKNCCIRIPISKPRTVKSSVITLTGALTLKKQLIERGIPHNSSFSGVYNFSNKKNYPDYFRQFLKNIGPYGIIMCHPGLVEKNDGIASAREQEFNYFNSQQFLEDCKTHGIDINPLRKSHHRNIYRLT